MCFGTQCTTYPPPFKKKKNLSLSCCPLRYRRSDNSLVVFADDQAPRLTTAFCFLDYDTVPPQSGRHHAPCF